STTATASTPSSSRPTRDSAASPRPASRSRTDPRPARVGVAGDVGGADAAGRSAEPGASQARVSARILGGDGAAGGLLIQLREWAPAAVRAGAEAPVVAQATYGSPRPRSLGAATTATRGRGPRIAESAARRAGKRLLFPLPSPSIAVGPVCPVSTMLTETKRANRARRPVGRLAADREGASASDTSRGPRGRQAAAAAPGAR